MSAFDPERTLSGPLEHNLDLSFDLCHSGVLLLCRHVEGWT